ncbi:MAG: hypothetical protein R3Y62_05590 [Eubacteriales bacterium]
MSEFIREFLKGRMALWGIVGGIVLIGLFPALIPIGIIVLVMVLIAKNGKKQKKAPLSSAQKSEYRQNPPKPPQRPSAPSPQPTVARKATQHPAYDPSRFVRVTTDYGARHRQNAKRMFDAGLIERDEYNMQIARSHNL